MKRTFFLLAIICTPFVVLAQELPEIIKTTQFKQGIYKSFAEFLSNSPSIQTSFTVVRVKILLGGESDKYKLIMQDSEWSRRDRKKFWGVCDGKEVYINESNYVIDDNFDIILRKVAVGRYCYFLGTVVYGNTTSTVNTTSYVDKFFIMNINNGNYFQLTKNVLRIILKKDKDLFNLYEFENRKGGEEVMVKYISEYNKKHLDEITSERKDSLSVVLYRGNNKVSDDAIIQLSDSTEVNLKVNSMYQFKSNERFSTICVNNKCKEYALPNQKVIYIECTWNKKSNNPTLKVMDAKIAEFYVNKIANKQSLKN